MRARITALLGPPEFADEGKARQAKVLNVVLWIGLALILAHIAATLVLPTSPFLNIDYEILVALLHAICLVVLRLRHPRTEQLWNRRRGRGSIEHHPVADLGEPGMLSLAE